MKNINLTYQLHFFNPIRFNNNKTVEDYLNCMSVKVLNVKQVNNVAGKEPICVTSPIHIYERKTMKNLMLYKETKNYEK